MPFRAGVSNGLELASRNTRHKPTASRSRLPRVPSRELRSAYLLPTSGRAPRRTFHIKPYVT
eukprot:7387434-Prymnesium_polylepis.1